MTPTEKQLLIREAAYLVDYFQMSYGQVARYLRLRHQTCICAEMVSRWFN